eukprot:gene11631-3354_t
MLRVIAMRRRLCRAADAECAAAKASAAAARAAERGLRHENADLLRVVMELRAGGGGGGGPPPIGRWAYGNAGRAPKSARCALERADPRAP